MSKVYDALPSAASVAIAVEVRSSVCGSPTSPTADWLRWRASTAPRASWPYAVSSSTGRPRRARATATLAALPPACSTVLPSGRWTMSIRDSPTTNTPVMPPACRTHRPGRTPAGPYLRPSPVPAAPPPGLVAPGGVCWGLEHRAEMQSSARGGARAPRQADDQRSSRPSGLVGLLGGLLGSSLLGGAVRGGTLLRAVLGRGLGHLVGRLVGRLVGDRRLLGGLRGGSRLGGGNLLPRCLLGRLGGLRLVGLGDQLDHGHRGVVALAGADLGDPGVATRTLGERRRDLGEQRVHDRLVTHGLEHLAPVVQVAPLGLGDQLLGDRAQHSRLGLGGGDPAVLEQLRGQVGHDQPLVRGAAAEAGTLLGLGHGLSRFSPAVSGTGVDGTCRWPSSSRSVVSTSSIHGGQ